nr:putative RNA-directed DNA polymerase, eukaryota, reverse transcriptase zinc-binding domain protein [Tanacetum cinerariifolium]
MSWYFVQVKHIHQSFVIDERVVWIEISSLPLNAWSPKAFKKVAGIGGSSFFVDEDPNETISIGRVCIKTRIHGYIKDTCKVTVSGKSFNVFVNEFADWNPDTKDSDSLPSINSEKDQSVNHEDDFVKNTQWSEEADLGNCGIKHEDPVRSPKENSDVPLDDPKSLSQPPVFEAFNSNSNISSARKPHKSYKQPSHFSSAPVKSSHSDSLPSINSEKDQSINHEDGLSDNGSPDTEEAEIPNSKNNEVEDFVKNTQWSEEAELGNSGIKHEDPVRFPKENSDVPLDDPQSFSQPPGFEAFNSNSNISSARKPHKSYKQPSHFSSAPVKSSRSNKSQTKPLRNHGSMIEAFVSHIEMGKVLGYDMEGSKNDLKKFIDRLGANQGTWIASHIYCFMINVYAPQDANNKILLWNEIRDFMNNNKGLHLLFGDFNKVIFSSDRIDTVFNPSSANSFNQFIRDNNLWDIPLGGHLFTRLNKRGDKLSKLDHFLASGDFIPFLQNVSGQVLECHISGHSPILLAPMAVDFGPTPFKFFNSLLEDKNLHSCINDFWTSYNTNNCMNHIVSFKNKMKDLKNAIKEWSKNRRKDQIREKEDIIKKINAFDANITSRSSDFVADDQGSSWIDSLRKIEVNESLDLSQKAKIKWCIEADENSKFFHAMVNQKHIYLAIHGIKLDGHWIDEPHGIKKAFTSFFEQKFKNIKVTKVVNRSPFYNSLSTEQSCLMDSLITLDEIKNAIWACGLDKSPGPDGFTFAVYKEFWITMKDDVANFIKHFFNTGNLPRGCNTSFITLIPKVLNPLVVSDFRPIILIRAQYKIIAKILANRHACVIDSIISHEQSAFIKHRQILDGPLMVNEINGSPTREFNIERGLRQGDPLSPLLFIIAMEGLHSKGVWSRFVGSINRIHEKNLIPLSSIKRQVNNGASTKFWYDSWAGTSPFKSLFPRLFQLAVNKDCLVRDNRDNGWSFDWVRNISSDSNASQLESLQNPISSITLNDSEDNWVWSLGGHSFTVRSAHCQIDWGYLPDQGP